MAFSFASNDVVWLSGQQYPSSQSPLLSRSMPLIPHFPSVLVTEASVFNLTKPTPGGCHLTWRVLVNGFVVVLFPVSVINSPAKAKAVQNLLQSTIVGKRYCFLFSIGTTSSKERTLPSQGSG